MDPSQSLLLDEEEYGRQGEGQRSEFIYEWLSLLKTRLPDTDQADVKQAQRPLVDQLIWAVCGSPGAATRPLLAQCLSLLLRLGDPVCCGLLVEKFNDIIRSKDDAPSALPTRLAAIACLGSLYEQLGRLLVHSFRDTLSNLLRAMKTAESQGRCEVMLCVERMLCGVATGAVSCHRDIYKAARVALSDRCMSVRIAAAKCLLQLQQEAVFLWSSELENVASVCFRAFEGSTHGVRVAVATFLGTLLARAVELPAPPPGLRGGRGRGSLEEVMDLLNGAFQRGGAGFLRMKGSSLANRDVRLGVTQTCVVLLEALGGLWLEAQLPALLPLLMELCCRGGREGRACVSRVLASSLRPLLGEQAQRRAARTLAVALVTQTRPLEAMLLGDCSQETRASVELSVNQHVVVCGLLELGAIVQGLGSTAPPLLIDTALPDTVLCALLHPSPSPRLSAAWCLRCVASALPSQHALLLDRCAERLAAMKTCPEAVAGYSAAIAALLAGVQHCTLGIPHSKGKMVLSLAEDLLRSASQNSRLSLQRAQAGWLLLSALCTLGPAVVQHHLYGMVLLCKCVFPPSLREQDMELKRGDYFTWQVTLAGRAGALCVMRNLLLHCRDLVTDDIISRLLTPLACAVALLSRLGSLRCHGPAVSEACVVYRLRLYQVLTLLAPHTYQESYGAVMKQLVTELSGQDAAGQSSPGTTLLPALCHRDDLPLLRPALEALEHEYKENQLPGSGGGFLDNDPYALCEAGEAVPMPLPPATEVTSAAVRLFGTLFPHVISAQRLQILDHFIETVNQLKGQRQQTVRTLDCAALCSLLQALGGTGGALGPEELRSPALGLLLGALQSSCPLLRCLAAEGTARLVQAVGDPAFTLSVSLLCLDRLKGARDAVTRSGHALCLGALYRHVGGTRPPHHLSTCLGVLFTLAQDSSCPAAQSWAVHGLALVVDQSGGVLGAHADACSSLLLRLLLSTPCMQQEVLHSVGRCLQALICCLGPDLHGGSSVGCVLRCVALLQAGADSDSVLQACSVSCLQALHLFSPQHVQLQALVPRLCVDLCSPSLCVREAVASCLRQLAQREELQVSDHASLKDLPRSPAPLGVSIREVGLHGALFCLLDRETDGGVRTDIQETIVHMMMSNVSAGKLSHCLKLCKDVLSASAEGGSVAVEAFQVDQEEAQGDDDSSALPASSEAGPFSALRWSTRRFAVECVCRILELCEDTHFSTDFLVLHLGDLVRMAFMAATDASDGLRLAGLHAMLLLIRLFCCVEEPEFPGHPLLEQYQANVGAALRPAFSADASPIVTVKACQVCSAWIVSGVVGDLRDLRRVHQLLAASLAKVQGGRDSAGLLYSEATVTMETLAVLKAWAEVYIAAVQRSRPSNPSASDLTNEEPASGSGGAGLLNLVQSDLPTLSRLWLAALHDHAHLTLPLEHASQLPAAGGAFYTPETVQQARSHYTSSWAPILHATALWLQSTGFVTSEEGEGPATLSRPATPTSMGHTSESVGGAKGPEDVNTDRLYLVLGVSVEFLCCPHSVDLMENITSCLRALQAVLCVPWARTQLGHDQVLGMELLSVLHRVLVTREGAVVQRAVLDVVRLVVMAAQEHVKEKRHSAEVDDGASEKETVPEFGEGRETGGLVPGRSLVFGALELCLCVLVRKLPQLSPTLAPGGAASTTGLWTLSDSDCQLVTSSLLILSDLPSLCSPEGSVCVLPAVLYLLLGVLKEITHAGSQSAEGPGPGVSGVLQGALQALKALLCSPMSHQEKSRAAWRSITSSALYTLLTHTGPADQPTLLTVVSVFLLWCDPDVGVVQPAHTLCVELFTACMESKHPQVVSRCFQVLTSIFQGKPDVAGPYILKLGPPLVRFLQGAERRRPQTEQELQGVIEALHTMEALVDASDHTHRPQLAAILLPIFISLLLDENALDSAPAASRSLHDWSLKELSRLGPQHPSVFRSLVFCSPQLKARLQAAVRGDQRGPGKTRPPGPAQSKASPSITLKTNFL